MPQAECAESGLKHGSQRNILVTFLCASENGITEADGGQALVSRAMSHVLMKSARPPTA